MQNPGRQSSGLGKACFGALRERERRSRRRRIPCNTRQWWSTVSTSSTGTVCGLCQWLLSSVANSTSAECIYSRLWARQPDTTGRPIASASNNTNTTTLVPQSTSSDLGPARARPTRLSAQDDAKLIFGTIFSLRNMVRKLGGQDDSFISYRTGQYKLHYYETPTSIKFVMLTDTQTLNMRNVLHQIYVNLYVEFGE